MLNFKTIKDKLFDDEFIFKERIWTSDVWEKV